MLAKPEKPEAAPEKPEVPLKQRIITLTHRAPIRIIEEHWPVIAQSGTGEGYSEAPWEWGINMRVRQHTSRNWHYLIHGKFESRDDGSEENTSTNQTVRVGRLVSALLNQDDLYRHILETGEELRERINLEKLRRHVTLVIDGVFAQLTPADQN